MGKKIKITIEIDLGEPEDSHDPTQEYPRMIHCKHCGFKRMVNSVRHENNVKRGKTGHCDGTWITDVFGGDCFSP